MLPAKKKQTLALMFLLFAILWPAAAHAEKPFVIPWELRRCTTDKDCALVHEACGNNWTTANITQRPVVERLMQQRRAVLGCQIDGKTRSFVKCAGGYCVTGSDTFGCTLYSSDDKCLVGCDRTNRAGICEHYCVPGPKGCR